MQGMSERQYAAHVGLSRGAIQKAKTAERLVVEMKDRLKGWSEGALFTPYTDAMTAQPAETAMPSSVEDEAISALLALGYKLPQATSVVSKIYQPEMKVEAVIR